MWSDTQSGIDLIDGLDNVLSRIPGNNRTNIQVDDGTEILCMGKTFLRTYVPVPIYRMDWACLKEFIG